MILYLLLVVAGFVCLIYGANWLVDGASALAKKYKMSDLAIGLTIVAFGTSAPELVVNVVASINGHSDLTLGNVIGSNNFNTFIILGLSGLIMPIAVQSSTAYKEIPMSLFITVLLLFMLNDFGFSGEGSLSRFDAIVLFALFLLFMYYVFNQMKSDSAPATAVVVKSNVTIGSLILLGLVGLAAGGHLVVKNSVAIANALGVSEKIIGLTIVAAGTSLPELATSVVAAIKKNSDIAIGNIIGSNIFNISLILSVSAFIRPIAYNPKFNQDLLVLIGGTVFLLMAVLIGKRKQLSRWEAAFLFVSYASYMLYLVMQEL